MIGEIKVTYCPICESDTDHLQGCFKCKEVSGELFHFDVSLTDTMRKLSSGFKDFVLEGHGGVMDGDVTDEYVKTRKGGLDFEKLFSPQVRSLKCVSCGHLLKISRLP